MVDPLIAHHREEIVKIAARHGASNLRVFGSAAKGLLRADSDVDFLIDIAGPVTPWFPGGLISDLSALLGRRVDIATEKELRPSIRESILKDAVPI